MNIRSPKIDPLEETLENPDLPPIVPVRGLQHRAVAAPAGRGSVRVLLGLGALLILALSLRLVA